jgi:molybdopterin-guanine dinucleotide biosynthesis protein A
MYETSFSCAVLAGGASSRMGRDKSLLLLNGEPLIQRVLNRLSEITDDLLVVTDESDKYEFLRKRVRFAGDIGGMGQGPLAGIAGALVKARYPRVAVVATDMPFINPALIRFLAGVDPTADVVVTIISEDGFPETLHAIYAKSALHAIQEQLIEGNRKITHFFDQVRVVTVPREQILPLDPDLHSFLNANTPDDWERIQALAENP